MARPLNQWPYEASDAPKQGSSSDFQISRNEQRVTQLPPSPNFPPGPPPPLQITPLSLVPPRDTVQSSHASKPPSLERPSPTWPPSFSDSFLIPPASRGAHYDCGPSLSLITPPVSERYNVSPSQVTRPHQAGQTPSAAGQYLSGWMPQLKNTGASGSASTNTRSEYPPPLPMPSQPPSPPSSQTQSPRRDSRSNMTVRALLNDDSSTPASPAQGPPHPPQPDNLQYDLIIRQQPERARSCGFGDRDRRVIDPPPILQLKIDSPGLPREDIRNRLRLPSYVVHCSIWSENGEEEMSGMPDDYTRQKRLMGSLVASPFVGFDDQGVEGCFFCFPDISCRTPGRYRLKFVLVVLDWPLRPNARSMVRAELLSDVFQTFSAKDFPGMLESTPLAKALKYQGCNIPTKKGNDKGGGKMEGSEDRSSDGEAPPRRKRARNNNL